MPVGFRVASRGPTIECALLERFKRVPVACISDSMFRMAAGGARLRPMGVAAMVGQAVTVKTAPGDNLMVHKALSIAREGDVVVVDAGGDLTNAIIGERMIAVAEDRKLAGIIINGAVRDAEALKDCRVPVFAAGVTHRGPYKNGPGEVNYPIAIDGMVICAGDIIVGDEDGFVVIPRADAAEICGKSEAKHQSEVETSPLKDGSEWIDSRLLALGCDF